MFFGEETFFWSKNIFCVKKHFFRLGLGLGLGLGGLGLGLGLGCFLVKKHFVGQKTFFG